MAEGTRLKPNSMYHSILVKAYGKAEAIKALKRCAGYRGEVFGIQALRAVNRYRPANRLVGSVRLTRVDGYK